MNGSKTRGDQLPSIPLDGPQNCFSYPKMEKFLQTVACFSNSGIIFFRNFYIKQNLLVQIAWEITLFMIYFSPI